MGGKKYLNILGSTGSIGQSTLEIVRRNPEQFGVATLAAHSRIDLLEIQAKEFHPKLIAVYHKEKAYELSKKLPHLSIVAGLEGLEEAAAFHEGDLCVSALSGSIGLLPTLRAIEAGHQIALANKEVLVSAGEIITKAAASHHVSIVPIDSEQSAIFQCLQGYCKKDVDRLILTASGGPFFRSGKDLSKVTFIEAMKHPTWNMGRKNTIDSSTLMNKGLEVIEAYWLFNIPIDRIDVVVHPQSLVHSFVEFVDGSLLAQIAENTMLLPIQYALSYPQRLKRVVPRFDFKKYSSWEFYEPDKETFICLDLAYQAVRVGGSLPCFMNAANEVLVERFADHQIRWVEIGEKLQRLMQHHKVRRDLQLADILDVEQSAREEALRA